MSAESVRSPRPVDPQDGYDTFDCGNSELNAWLMQKALASEGRSARTYVVTTTNRRIVAYYCLSAGAVIRASLPRAKLRQNMPDEVPVLVMGRLAVDRRYQGLGLGKDLLKDAILRALNAAELVGIRAILVHAKDEDAAAFYRRFGFFDSRFDEKILLLPIETAAACL